MLGGIVDVDRYTSPILLPFFATAVDGIHVLENGTALDQIILFHRATTHLPGRFGRGTSTKRQLTNGSSATPSRATDGSARWRGP